MSLFLSNVASWKASDRKTDKHLFKVAQERQGIEEYIKYPEALFDDRPNPYNWHVLLYHGLIRSHQFPDMEKALKRKDVDIFFINYGIHQVIDMNIK